MTLLLSLADAPAPAFTPAALPGLALWLDPARPVSQDAAGTAPAGDGDPVGRWPDRSGNGRHATAASGAVRPTYRPAGGAAHLAFDGVDDFLTFADFPQALPCTVYAVLWEAAGGPDDQSLLNRTDTGQHPYPPGLYTRLSSAGGAAGTYWGSSVYAPGPAPPAAGFGVVRFRLTAAAFATRVDAGAEASVPHAEAQLNHWTTISSVAGQQVKAKLGDLVIVQGAAVSAADDARLLAYLAAKYGIAL